MCPVKRRLGYAELPLTTPVGFLSVLLFLSSIGIFYTEHSEFLLEIRLLKIEYQVPNDRLGVTGKISF